MHFWRRKNRFKGEINTFHGRFNHTDVKENRAASKFGVTKAAPTRVFSD